MGRRYVCAQCGGTFIAGWAIEEAEAEARIAYGVANAASDPAMAEICDDCFRRFKEWEDDDERANTDEGGTR